MYDSRYWLWLSLIFKTGSSFCDSLLYAFNHNPKSIYEADKAALIPFCKNNDLILSRLSDKRLDRVYSILDFCQRENIGILTPESRSFPSSLLKIEGQPLVLYYKGRLPDFSRCLSVSVVGTRSVTAYGSSAAYTISHDLASTGAIVVSGMALGADTAAHRGALDAGGHTVAFLGCGIDIIYPKDNARLMQEIIARGTVITEYAPGLPPEGRHFPVRNRLISGVSSAVLVVEASEKSGALITASHGLRQGKLIYAVPGKVGELSSTGTNLLIRNGAKMVTTAKDIISDFSGLYEFRFTERQSTTAQSVKNTENQNSVKSESTDIFENKNPAVFQNNGFDNRQFSGASQNDGFENRKFAGAPQNNGFENRQFSGTSKNNSFDNRQLSGDSKNNSFKNEQFAKASQDNGFKNIHGVSNSNFKNIHDVSDGGFDNIRGVSNASDSGFDNIRGIHSANGNGFGGNPHGTGFENTGFVKPASKQRPRRLVAAQPRPTILYNGMTEEEVAASYMSMETEISGKTGFFPENVERVYLTYPKEPMPENGYEITLTEEGLKNFDKINEARFKTGFSETDRVFPVASYKAENDIVAAAASQRTEKKKKVSLKRIKSESNEEISDIGSSVKSQKADLGQSGNGKSSDKDKKALIPETKKALSFEGLNETESAVLKFVSEHQPVGIDGMNALNMPVPQLLSTLTMLEIKQKISQKPGGYFEIKN